MATTTAWQEHVREQLKARRGELGISQRALAERADIQQSDICRYETGTFTPTVGSLYKLASALGCTIHDLLPPTETV